MEVFSVYPWNLGDRRHSPSWKESPLRVPITNFKDYAIWCNASVFVIFLYIVFSAIEKHIEFLNFFPTNLAIEYILFLNSDIVGYDSATLSTMSQ